MKNIIVNTQKFDLARQNIGDDERDYHVGVERLSHDADLGTADNVRK